jgi:hypothetical protein
MFGGHGQDYSYDTAAFALSLIPFVFVAVLLAASLVQETLKVRFAPRERKTRK